MGKQLLLCFDGTWNRPAKAMLDRKNRVQTNVRWLYEATALAPDEEVPFLDRDTDCKFYDWGVGSWGCRLQRFVEGATGRGLDKNILDGYRFLARRYRDGDNVYIVGFSRGAYTARSLVGLIRNAGLLPDANDDALVGQAYDIYRRRDWSPDSQEARAFRSLTGARPIEIAFLGVFDTVGALGIPGLLVIPMINRCRYFFHDTELTWWVRNAFHAVAIDEHRREFRPALWTGEPKTGQVIEQVWFAGAHADVGGGYRSRGLSDVALTWLAGKARGCGLPVDEAALGACPDPHGCQHDSFKDFFGLLHWLLPRHRRTICPQGTADLLHRSVAERHGAGYAPRNPCFVQALDRPLAD